MARKIMLSGELWGRARRWGNEPVVEAYDGEIGNKVGIEFFTDVEPRRNTPPGQKEWRQSACPEVRLEGDFAKISIVVTRCTQVVDR